MQQEKGLPYTLRDFRCVNNLINAGQDAFVVSEITGQSLATLKRYAINPKVAVRRPAARMAEYVAARLESIPSVTPSVTARV